MNRNPQKTHLVRQIKAFPAKHVANVMHRLGWRWKGKRPYHVDKMVEGLARCELEAILFNLTYE